MAAFLAFTSTAAALEHDFEADLLGEQVVNREGGVDTDAEGRFLARVLGRGNRLAFELSAFDIEDVTTIHLHRAREDRNGPVVVRIRPDRPTRGEVDGELASGVITAEDLEGPFEGRPLRRLIAAMRNGTIYVDVHTRDHPRGEIRGQVREEEDRVRDEEDEEDDEEFDRERNEDRNFDRERGEEDEDEDFE